MELPGRVKRAGRGWASFVFFLALDTVLTALIAFGPSAALWLFLAPGGFWQRLAAAAACGVLFCVMAVCAFFFWAFFITKTTGW